MLSITSFTFIVAFCVALVILCIIGAFLLKFEEPTFSAEVVEEEKGTRISDFWNRELTLFLSCLFSLACLIPVFWASWPLILVK